MPCYPHQNGPNVDENFIRFTDLAKSCSSIASRDYLFSDSLTITPASLTASVANQNKVYGANDPSLRFAASVTGLVNRAVSTWNGSVTVNDSALTSNATALTRAGGESVGSYNITAGSFSTPSTNYSAPTFTGTPTLTIGTASLTASVANQNKVYGADDPTLPFAASVTGLINRSVSTWNGSVTVNDSALTSNATALTRAVGESVGSYNITAGTFSTPSTNYSAPTFTGSPTLTIGTASLTATIANQSKVYGADDPNLSGITVSLGGAINRTVTNWNGAHTVINDTGNVSTSLSSLSRTAGETVAGGPYAYTSATFSPLTGSASSNYSATLAGGSKLTITPRQITIAADSQSKTYGSSDPAFTYAVGGSGLANNPGTGVVDTQASVFSGAMTRVSGETVSGGPYAITQGTLAANSNYSVTSFAAANLNVTTVSLSVTADEKAKLAGDFNPAFTASFAGLKFTDTPASLGGTLSFATAATKASTAGNYAIIPSGLSSSDYSISYFAGTLKVGESNLSNTSSVQNALLSFNIPDIQRAMLPDLISYANGTPISFNQPPITLSSLNEPVSPDDINSLSATAAGGGRDLDRQPQELFDRNVKCYGSTPIQAFSCR